MLFLKSYCKEGGEYCPKNDGKLAVYSRDFKSISNLILYMLKQKIRESKDLQSRMLGKVEIELFSVFCSYALLLALLYMFLLLVVQGEWEKKLPLLGFLVQ